MAFLVVIVFLDENSLIQRAQHKREISTLKSEIARYRKQYEEDTRKLKELMNNPEALEKIAREKYLMKKPNEDIFIFEE
jgi:cell division protein FtsB